jgi:hypothetical protein
LFFCFSETHEESEKREKETRKISSIAETSSSDDRRKLDVCPMHDMCDHLVRASHDRFRRNNNDDTNPKTRKTVQKKKTGTQNTNTSKGKNHDGVF